MVINPIVGVYIPTVRIPIKGGMTIPNIATFDHGTYKPIESGVRCEVLGIFWEQWDTKYLGLGMNC